MRVGGVEHLRDRGGQLLLGLLQLVVADPDRDQHDRGGRGDQQPRGPASRSARQVPHTRWHLRGAVGGCEHPGPQLGGRLGRLDLAHQCGGVGQLAHLLAAGGALGEVAAELLGLLGAQRVQGVGARQRVQLGAHRAPSRQSRRRINPSLILVLIVGSGLSSKVATSR